MELFELIFEDGYETTVFAFCEEDAIYVVEIGMTAIHGNVVLTRIL